MEFKAISPTNNIYEVNNIIEFAKANDLDVNRIKECLEGKRYHCKRWIFKKEKKK